jgi:uracil-DNA glycosylase
MVGSQPIVGSVAIDRLAVLSAVEQEVVGCRACPRLVAWRESVAAQPRAAFRGQEFLYAALHRVGLANQPTSTWRDDGLALTDVWITAPVRCAPPANKPTPAERDRCLPYMARELEVLDARVFVALGAFGYQALCGILGVTPRPRFAHGVEVPLPDGRWLLGSYHVSQQNTFTGTLTEPMFDAVLERAKTLARQ